MEGFSFWSPTKVVFGRHGMEKLGAEVTALGGKRVLVFYGGESAVKNGLIAQLEDALKGAGVTYVLRGGVQPNPLCGFVQRAVDDVKSSGIDLVLAVGGGSVIDTAKAAAIALAGDAPVWNYFCGKTSVTAALPVGVVLTIAAAGSETSDSAVLTNEDTLAKRGVNTDWNRPKFAIMDPTLTYSLPPRQTACGVTDIMMHTMDRFFAPPAANTLTDRIAVALLRTTIEYGRLVMLHPEDYEARSELMWAGSLSHNNLTGLGRTKDFSVHALGHELSAMFDLPHGESLSILWPAWARYVLQTAPERFSYFAHEVWGLPRRDGENPHESALAGIAATERYFRELGMPVTLGEAVGVQPDAVLHDLAYRCTFGRTRKVGVFQVLEEADLYEIYRSVNH